jgi:hypothetical protein
MEVLGVESLLYVSWRPDVTHVFQLHHNSNLFTQEFDEAKSVFAAKKPSMPNKLSDEVASLRLAIAAETGKATFLGEFLSISSSDMRSENSTETITVDDSIAVLKGLLSLLNEGDELKREKASEAVVFLCCDLNRNWSKYRFMWCHVCWFPQ